MRNLIATFRRLHDRWSRRRASEETERSFGNLDTHTLRDLGLHRSEIGSVPWDAARRTDSTRARVAGYHPY